MINGMDPRIKNGSLTIDFANNEDARAYLATGKAPGKAVINPSKPYQLVTRAPQGATHAGVSANGEVTYHFPPAPLEKAEQNAPKIKLKAPSFKGARRAVSKGLGHISKHLGPLANSPAAPYIAGAIAGVALGAIIGASVGTAGGVIAGLLAAVAVGGLVAVIKSKNNVNVAHRFDPDDHMQDVPSENHAFL